MLHKIEQERPPPIQYEYGSRGPAEADEMIAKQGFVAESKYTYNTKK